MVIKQTPMWARWAVAIGLLLPMFCFMFLQEYNPRQGVFWNFMNQRAEFSALNGQNPIRCLSEGFERAMASPFGYTVAPSYACQRHTIIPYRHIIVVSMGFLFMGLYGYLRGHQIANTRPTEWDPFSQENVKKKSGPVKLRNESPEDSPVKPYEGGF